jgi:hypothetical protein
MFAISNEFSAKIMPAAMRIMPQMILVDLFIAASL